MDSHNDKSRGREKVLSPGVSTEAESSEIDHVAEQKLVRKLDLRIIPLVMLLYLFSFLDRQVIHPPSYRAFLLIGEKGQHWECEIVRAGGRSWFERKPISDSYITALCNLCFD